MESINRNQASGSDVRLQTSSRLHFNDLGMHPKESQEPKDAFSKILFKAVNDVNSLQQTSDELELSLIHI